MGNGICKLRHCFAGEVSRRHDIAVILGDPLHEGLGHSFCYVPDRTCFSSKVHSDYSATTSATTAAAAAATNVFQTTTLFHSISGASVSANVSTQTLSMALIDSYPYSNDRSSTFESSDCFASLPLQPVPRSSFQSGSGASLTGSGPMERGFLSGPIERFVSGPIDRGLYSGPIVDKEKNFEGKLQRSLSQNGVKEKSKKQNLIKVFKRVISSTISRGDKSFKGVKEVDLERNNEIVTVSSGSTLSSRMSSSNEGVVVVDDDDGEFSMKSQNLQWAQGKAGEDRVHIVVSEKHGWVFVGIYDGFNGPDAPDYLLTNLYTAVHKELKGLLWNDKFESAANSLSSSEAACLLDEINQYQMRNSECLSTDKENHRLRNGEMDLDENLKGKKNRNSKGAAKKWEESQKRWRCEWDRERLELERKLKAKLNSEESNGVNHSDVLKALSLALKKTEDSYLKIADLMARENPELALMGSCVLVMLMKGEDVYVMNVGDSRAVLGRKVEPNIGLGWTRKDLERIKEETMHDLEAFDDGEFDRFNNLTSHQLTVDHSTYVEEEVLRIKKEHPDDDSAVINDRVKGYLKVTRAFGAGFLKQPKWNNALLEMFRIDYVGTSPYITCFPALHHHRLSPRDKFLILSSDGLYQYFTNEQAVCEVESFIAAFPEGDPAQHLIEEVLFRAAKKAGMDFHELLDIPQGERRRYHDDVSVIIISFEGRIWRSSV